MENSMGNQLNEAVGDNDPPSSMSMVLVPSGIDNLAAIASDFQHIFEGGRIDWRALDKSNILSEQALKTDEWNFGFSGYPKERKEYFVSIMQTRSFGDNNMPYPRKDTFERRVGSKNKLIPPNYQEILKAVRDGNTIPIPDLEDDMGDPMPPSCNSEMYVGGSSCTHNSNELGGEVKMSCAMASRNTY